MKRILARSVRISILSCAVLALGASAASAATIRYDIPETSAYTVDNTSGIAKVTFNGCVIQRVEQRISFQTVLESTNPGNATYKVLQDSGDEGELPTPTFAPPTVAVTGQSPQTIDTTLAFTLDQISPSGTVFRFKLDPEPGVGLGEGPGVMVKINCVQAAALLAPSGQTPAVGATPVPLVAVPTSAVAAAAAGPARCLAQRAVRLRATSRSTLTVIVATSAGRVKHAYVRITGPGIRIDGFTNNRGLVSFRVTPSRRGNLYIQSNVCIGADRLAVLAANAAPKSAVGALRAGYTG